MIVIHISHLVIKKNEVLKLLEIVQKKRDKKDKIKNKH